MTFACPDRFRVRKGPLSTPDGADYGLFWVPIKLGAAPLRVIASRLHGWEHVSVSLPDRCPTWIEMSFVKDQFWSDDDCVMQLHPPKDDYVNCHPYCLHLWRPYEAAEIPRPPSMLVGPGAGAIG